MRFKIFTASILILILLYLLSCNQNNVNIIPSISTNIPNKLGELSYIFSNFPQKPSVTHFSDTKYFFTKIIITNSVSNANYYFVAHSNFENGPFEKISFDINFEELGLEEYTFNDFYTDPLSRSYYKIYACSENNACVSSEVSKTIPMSFLETRIPQAGTLLSDKRIEILASRLASFGLQKLDLFNTSSESSVNITIDNFLACTREDKKNNLCSEEEDISFAVPEFYKIEYTTTYKGKSQTAFGLICLPARPNSLGGNNDDYYQNKPLILAQHSFTSTESKVPSAFKFLDQKVLAGILRGFLNNYLRSNPIEIEVNTSKEISILTNTCTVSLELSIDVDSIDILTNLPINMNVTLCPENPDINVIVTALAIQISEDIQDLLIEGIRSQITSHVNSNIEGNQNSSTTVTGPPLDLEFRRVENTLPLEIQIIGSINLLETFDSLFIVFDNHLKLQGFEISIRDFISDLGSGPILDIKDLQFSEILSSTLLELYCILGYPIFLPDYIGYQNSSDIVHPYFDKYASAHATIDFIEAGMSFLEKKRYHTNQKLYMFGYDEGAYVTIASVTYLEENPILLRNLSLELDGVVVGGGIYDLSNIFERHFQGSSLLKGENTAFYFYQLYKNVLEDSVFEQPNTQISLEHIFTEKYVRKIENNFFSSTDILIDHVNFSNRLYDIFQAPFITSINLQNTLLSRSIMRELRKNSLKPFSSSIPIHFFYSVLDRETGDSTGILTREFANNIQTRSSNCISSSELIFLNNLIPGFNIDSSFVSAVVQDLASFTVIGEAFQSFYGDELDIHLLNNFQMILESLFFIFMRSKNITLCSK